MSVGLIGSRVSLNKRYYVSRDLQGVDAFPAGPARLDQHEKFALRLRNRIAELSRRADQQWNGFVGVSEESFLCRHGATLAVDL